MAFLGIKNTFFNQSFQRKIEKRRNERNGRIRFLPTGRPWDLSRRVPMSNDLLQRPNRPHSNTRIKTPTKNAISPQRTRNPIENLLQPHIRLKPAKIIPHTFHHQFQAGLVLYPQTDV